MAVFESDVDIACGVDVSKEGVIVCDKSWVSDCDDVVGDGEVVSCVESLVADMDDVRWVEVSTTLLVGMGSEVLVGGEVPTADCEAAG